MADIGKFRGLLVFGGLVYASLGVAQVNGPVLSPARPAAAAQAKENYARLPLAFEKLGGVSGDRFLARGEGYVVGLENGKATIQVLGKHKSSRAVSLEFAGSRPGTASPGPELPGKVNYLRGTDKDKWQLGLSTYERVSWPDVYPGIDVVYYGNQRQLEFDLVVKPGADPGAIRLKVAGAGKLSIDSSGALNLGEAAGGLRVALPQIYQNLRGTKRSVAGHYAIVGRDEVAFRVDSWDRAHPLVIDPTIVYSELFGGGLDYDEGEAIGLDSSGNILIAGDTSAADFPTVNAAQSGLTGNESAFVTKINAAGTALIYSTYLGGSSYNEAYGIAVDSTGAAWVTGYTDSSDFPVLNAAQPVLVGPYAAFVARLNASGALQFSTFLSGNSYTFGYGIAVDSSGNGYVTGLAEGSFPIYLPTTTGTAQAQGGGDAFVTKYSPTGSIVYSTLLGGTSYDEGYGIAVDSSGSAYVAGTSYSSTFTGAPSGGAQTSNNGGGDAYVAKLSANGTSLLYFTFLGGTDYDEGYSIAVDIAGNAYIGGQTSSTGLATTGAAQTTLLGGTDGFAAKLNPSGSAFSYVTYLGGNRLNYLYGLALDASGNVYLSGYTDSTNFPAVSALQPTLPGNGVSLFSSTNSGSSFSAFDTNIPGAVFQISINPSGASAVVLTEQGIYRTTNGGASWTQQYSGEFDSGSSLTRSPVSPGTLYASSCCTTVYSSTDDGVTWTYAGSTNFSTSGIVADPLTAGTVYLFGSSSPYVSISTNGGATWSPAGTGLPSQVDAMVATTDGSLYAGTNGSGIYKSTNQGGSWTAVNNGLPAGSYTYSYSLSASGATVYFAFGSIYVTTDGGANWATTSESYANAYEIAASPTNAAVLYAIVYNPANGYYTVEESSDSGVTFSAPATGLPSIQFYDTELVVDPNNSAHALLVVPVSQAGFVAKLNSAGSSLTWSTYLGGTEYSYAYTEANGIATDGSGNVYVTGYTDSVGYPITSSALPAGTYGAFITKISDTTAACTALTVSPGSLLAFTYSSIYTFSVVAPSGCSWTASTNQSWATISSGASGTGPGDVTVSLTGQSGTATSSANLTVNSQVVPITLPGQDCSYVFDSGSYSVAAAGGAVSATLTATEGCPWAVTNDYPSAISFTTPSSGSGNATIGMTVTPNLSAATRSFYFEVGNTDITITQVSATLAVTTTSLPAGALGAPYGTTLSAGGGTSPYNNWTVTSGAPPPGLTLNSATGVISGTPTTVTGSPFSFTVTVMDSAGNTSAPQSLSIAIGLGPQTISFDAIPNQILGVSPFPVAAQSSALLPVKFVSNYPSVCKIADDLVILRITGTCSITASQSGNASYAATSITRTFNVNEATAGGSFGPAVGSPFGAGTDAIFLASADFNGDGIPDLAVANYESGNITVLKGSGSGGFTPFAGSPITVGSGAFSVAVGDFNGDGVSDLAVASEGGTATVLLGNGSGGFTATAGSPFTVGVAPDSIAIGDFNGDGIQDLAVANFNSGTAGDNSVAVLLGNGSGGFTAVAGSPFAVGNGPSAVVVGDFNGDGFQDLATANFNDENVTVLLGNGSGGFTPAPGSPFAAGGTPESLAVGDFNGDGIQDLAVANYNGNNVAVLKGNGSGGFKAFSGSPVAVGSLPTSVVVGDFNGDGIQDLAVANSGTNNITVLTGNGSGGFAAAATSPFAAGASPYSAVTADFNGDGIEDLATANFGGANVTVLLGAVPPTITSVTPASTPVNNPSASVTIGGSGFTSGYTVLFTPPGGTLTSITPSALTVSQITATIPVALLTTAGAAQVQVANASGVPSASLSFTVLPLMISSVTPNTAAAGSGATSVTIDGQYFNSGAVVQWITPAGTTVPITPSAITAAQLTVTIPSSLLTTAGTADFYVSESGSSASSVLPFTISAPAPPPTISSLSPYSATAGGPAFTLTVNGSNFVSGCTVDWGSTALATTFVGTTQLTASVPMAQIASAATASVTVACTGVGTSSAAAFTILTPTGQTWTQLTPTGGPPAARAAQTSVFDPATGQMIVFGGNSGGSTTLNDVWSLASAIPQWTNITPDGAAPAAREGASAIYDSTNSRMTIFGGAESGAPTSPASCANDVWTLTYANGVGGSPQWIQLSPTGTAPAARVYQGAVYDPGSNRMIVFGGYDCAGSVSNDVWVLTNANGLGGTPAWTQLSTTGTLPAQRGAASVAYDPASNTMIIFGGLSGSDADFNDVWVLSNANGVSGTPAWTELSPTGAPPAARYFQSAIYDSASNHMTVFGGASANSVGTQILNDTWLLSGANGLGGATWTQLAPLGIIPPPRGEQTTVFAAAADQMIVFGGLGSGSADFNDVWTLSDANGVPSTAGSVTIGALGGFNCFPYSCGYSEGLTEWQQHFAASAFGVSGPISIQDFVVTAFSSYIGLGSDTGTFKVYLSTAVNTLGHDSTSLAGNIGPDNTLFATVTFGPTMPASFTVTGNAPFVYNPADGDLLIDVQFTGASSVLDTNDSFFNADSTGTATQRNYSSASGSSANMAGALVTQFNYTLGGSTGPPAISSVTPSSTPVNNPSAAITIAGANFASGSTVLFTPPGGTQTSITPSTIAASQIAATIPATLLSTSGAAQIAVLNASGAESASTSFTISPLGISSVTPNYAMPGSGATSVAIAGQYFNSGAVVEWTTPGGTTVPITPSLISAAQVTATISSTLLSTPGTAQIAVLEPGSTESNSLSFPIANLPSISGLSPYSATAGTPVTLTVIGSNFVSGCTVDWATAALATTFVSATQLTAIVPDSLLPPSSGSVGVTVACTGVGTSPPATFTIQPPSGQTWTQLSPAGALPPVRASQTAVFDPVTSQMIVFGGSGSDGNLNDVWSLAPSGASLQWTAITPTGTPPSARASPTAIYDSTNARMTIFGGATGGSLVSASSCVNDVWTLTNANSVGGTPAWTQLSPTGTPPSPRNYLQAVYDPGSNRMIVFGGNNCTGPNYNDTWVLTNANGLGGTPAWIQLSPTGTLPAGRSAYSAVYDPTSNEMIVFGGNGPGSGNGSFLNDVWILSDANGVGGTPAWTQLSPTGTPPAGRAAHTAVYDPASNRMTVFGGLQDSGPAPQFFSDTWVLSNANGSGGTPVWTQLAPLGTIPAARFFQSAVLAPAANQMIMFAGSSTGVANLNDVWTLSDSNAVISISSLSPNSTTTGGSGFTLTVNGAGFISGSTVEWNGTPLSTTYVSSTQLTAWVGSGLLASSGIVGVTVLNPSGVASAAAMFTINASVTPPPPPTPLSITTTSLPNGTYNHTYGPATLTATGGSGSYSWSISGVPGLTVNASTGALGGAPTSVGAQTLTATVTDSSSNIASANFTITVNYPALVITSSVPATGMVNQPYGPVTLTASGGSGSGYTWSGSGIAGVSVSSTGMVSGTPTTAGNFSLSVTVTDSTAKLTATASYSVTIAAAPLTITTTSLPAGTALVSYGPYTLAATGGTGTYTWSGTGTPPGVSVSSAGSVGGTPTSGGTFTVMATVTDQASKTVSASFSITITAAPVTISGSGNLGGFVPGASVSGSYSAKGGVPPYIFSASGLPSSLSLSSAGALTGAAPQSPGSYSFSVTVSDSETPPQTASTSTSLSVLGFLSSSLPSGSTGTAYSGSVSATGGTPPYTFSASGVPAGLSFASSGFLSGTPTAAGSFTLSVQLSDSAGLTVSGSFGITIASGAQPVEVSGVTLPSGSVEAGYSQTLPANNGKPPYTWTILGGSLPPGLALSGGGTIAGTPTAIGTSSFTAQATDSTGGFASAAFTIVVNPAVLMLSAATLPDGIATAAYPAQIITATGGTPPYTFALTSGSLPAGLSFANGQIAGIPTTAATTGFTITVTDSAMPQQTASGEFSLNIDPLQPALVLAQGSASFALSTGATALPAGASIPVRSSITTDVLNYSLTPPASAPWLSVSAGGGLTPDTIGISLTSAALSLAPSTYSASITVNCIAPSPSPCAGTSQTIGVTLTVSAPAPQLSVSTTLLSFSATNSSATQSQPLNLTNTGGGVITVDAVTAADPWVTVSGVPSTIAAGVSVPVTVTVNPSGLAANYYQSSIAISTSAGSATVAVALLVATSPTLTLNPAGTQFLALQGSAPGNTSGSFLVSVSGSSTVNWVASVMAGGNTSWLTLNTPGGSSTSASPGMVSYSINPSVVAGLAAQSYYAAIEVTSGDVVDGLVTYQVVLNVSPTAGAAATPDPEPAGEVFIYNGTGTAPPQSVAVYTSSATAVTYQASSDSPWLSVSPATGTTSSAAAGQSTITVTPGTLAAGVYRGNVSYAISSAASRSVNVTLIVEAVGGTTPAAASGTAGHATVSSLSPAQSSACTANLMVPTQTGLVNNFAQPTSWPTPLTISLMDDCGSPITNGQVVTTFTNGDPPLVLEAVGSGSGQYTGTWTPRSSSPQVTITARATAPGFSAATIQIAGEVTPNPAPILNANGTINAFVPTPGSPLAPGMIVQIYGANMAAQQISSTTVPLTTSIGNTSVLIGGVEAPLYFVSPGQINAQVPFELAPGTPYQVLVNANGAISTPVSVQMGLDAPGIASLADGEILAQHANGTLVTDASPAMPGEYIVFYVAGMGATTTPVASGQPSPSNPVASTLDTPTLTLNGVNVPIYFAGLTPTFVGLYQVNFQVPVDTPNGDLQLILTQSGGQSNATILAVHN